MWPPRDRRERITTHREGGWLATGECGRPHLVGKNWAWWQCTACKRIAATRRINASQAAMLQHFYPDGETA